VLLDLLGAPDPTVPSYFLTTHWAYQRLASIEERLRKLNVLTSKGTEARFLREAKKKPTQFSPGFVEDDHMPFMARGVDILHIIPTPFPPVWHTMADTGGNLDIPTVDDWAMIVTAFAAEWMELDGMLPQIQARREARESAKTEL
jgi:glutaminyl-peptide cyclotransferase